MCGAGECVVALRKVGNGVDLWETLKSYVESGEEEEHVELKREVDLCTKPARAEFAKDVSALANTGREAYLIIGVVDARSRAGGRPEDYIYGFSCADWDEFRRQAHEAVRSYCNRPPKVILKRLKHPDLDKSICVVVIPRSFARPHAIKKSSRDIEENDIWVRRGPSCALATVAEIESMMVSQQHALVINLSHPLTRPQLDALELDCNCIIERVIDCPVRLDHQRSMADQVKGIVDSIGLTSHAWQRASIFVKLPGLAEAAATVLAELHGRTGHFPTVIRLRPVGESATAYEFAETINLQVVRDQSREGR